MLSSLTNQSFKDSFDSVDSIRVNYSLNISTCSQSQYLPPCQPISSLQVQPFIEFKKSGELRLFFRIFDENNLVSPVIIDSHIAVSHSQELSIHSEDRDALDALIEGDSTPVHQELDEDLNQQRSKSLFLTQQALKCIHSFDAQTSLVSNGEQQFVQNAEALCFNRLSFCPYKQKKLGNDIEQLKEEFAVSTASQEHSLDNQFIFNISPGKEGSNIFNDSLSPINLPSRIQNHNNPWPQQEFKTLKETQKLVSQIKRTKATTTTAISNRKRGQCTAENENNQIELNTNDLNGYIKKKAAKIEEKKDENTCNSKGNAVNMAKNILKGFMEYVFISAKEQDIITCCSHINETSTTGVVLPLKQLPKQIGDIQDEEEEENDYEEQDNYTNNCAEGEERDKQPCTSGISHNNNLNQTHKSSADSIRRRFRKQYNQKLLEKPSNSKLLKLFANTNYGLLFQHYFNSDEIMSYIGSSNIQNKLAHKDLVEKIRATAFDIDKLQDVLKTRIFKRPPFQKPQK